MAVVDDFVRELRANGNSPATCRSYAYDLLDWFRFLQIAETGWDRATPAAVRDYVLGFWRLTTPNAAGDAPTHRRRAP